MNIQTINQWIMIAKRIIRLSKRKHRDKRQHKLTKYFNLQPSVKPTKVTRPKVIEKKHNLYQNPMHNFLSMVSTFANIKPGQTIDQLIEIITTVPLLR